MTLPLVATPLAIGVEDWSLDGLDADAGSLDLSLFAAGSALSAGRFFGTTGV